MTYCEEYSSQNDVNYTLVLNSSSGLLNIVSDIKEETDIVELSTYLSEDIVYTFVIGVSNQVGTVETDRRKICKFASKI